MLHLYNTLTKQKETFEPTNPPTVTMYTCGPTVYGYSTIGNFSAYLMADLVKRYLKYIGYQVKQVINITDVGHLTADADVHGEDKIEQAAKKAGVDPEQIAQKYTDQFLSDAADLGIEADVWPKASQHIPEMLNMIEQLVDSGYAYERSSGIYFDVTKVPGYGQLSGNTLDQLKAGARVEMHPDKRHSADFALWKLNQPEHLMQWDSPWGKGYPGWHIECSAMSMKYLGDQIDIHTGGEDNIFPHHEAEIVQSQSVTAKVPFVKYWLHRRFLTVDGQKMSKSQGNTYRLQDLLDQGYDPEDFRMLIMSAHYRTGVNFTWGSMNAARERRLRWKRRTAEIAAFSADALEEHLKTAIAIMIREMMDDDLNTAETFALVDSWARGVSGEPLKEVYLWQAIDSLFGLGLSKTEELDSSIEQKRQQLDQAREKGDFALADRIRDEIVKLGYRVSTGQDGTKVTKK